jgi:hypothetical protein
VPAIRGAVPTIGPVNHHTPPLDLLGLNLPGSTHDIGTNCPDWYTALDSRGAIDSNWESELLPWVQPEIVEAVAETPYDTRIRSAARRIDFHIKNYNTLNVFLPSLFGVSRFHFVQKGWG